MFRLPRTRLGFSLCILLTTFMITSPIYNGTGFAQGRSGQNGDQDDDHPVVPPSSSEDPKDVGFRVHTNHVILLGSKPRITGGVPAGENPGSLACVYNLVNPSLNPGCLTNPSSASFINTNGGSGTIAIVDAFDYPTASADLSAFSAQFGLPAPNFQVVYATGQKPSGDCGWNQEAALDIEWAHAMAPGARIVLVEAASNSNFDLLNAVDTATSIVQQAGGGQVSMSWGGSEFRGETNYDSHFNASGVAYFAAAGDAGGRVIWPGVSANVISAGGTRVNRDTTGKFTSEAAWSREYCGGGPCGGGGGPSRYVHRPSYQNAIQNVVGSSRGTPDLSFDADPYSGVAVYENSPLCSGSNAGWMVFGGTSVASPALAGIVNSAAGATQKLGTGATNGYPEQTLMYGGYGSAGYYGNEFRDITSGNNGYAAKAGWDFATGIGSDQGLTGK
jgi:subtilase family serine protease